MSGNHIEKIARLATQQSGRQLELNVDNMTEAGREFFKPVIDAGLPLELTLQEKVSRHDSKEVATYGETYDRPQGNLTDLMTSKSTEYLTPSWILDLVEKVGPIDLDPCGHPKAEATRRSRNSYTMPGNDGLKETWSLFVTARGLVFVNPPYGRALKAWAEKMATAGCPVIALVPARTDTLWWKRMNPVAWCAVQGRLHFCGPDGMPIKDAAPFPSAVCLINAEGDQLARFVEAFKSAGIVYKRA